MTVHATPPRADHDVQADPAPPALVQVPGVRLAVVLWGGLAVVDVWRATDTPAYVALGALAVLAMLSSVGMRTGTAFAVAGVAWLVADGFVVHRYDVVRWDGTADLARLALLVGLATLATRVRR